MPSSLAIAGGGPRRVVVLALFCTLAACTSTVTVPSPSPAATPGVAAVTTATPTPTSTATPRQVRPFDRVVPLTLPPELGAAVDRDRIAFTDAGALHVLEVTAGQRRSVYPIPAGWGLELSPRGLRGDALVFGLTRIEGQRTDGRVLRLDLRTNAVATIDEWSGPFLGGGDGWRPQAPVTNETDILWIRVTAEAQPFSAEVMLAAGNARPRSIWTVPSVVWADLHDTGRVAISTLITQRDRAELVYWTAGAISSAGDRPSPDGGPVLFVGSDVFWGVGPRTVRDITAGELVGPTGARRRIDLQPDCGWVGGTSRHLHLVCRASQSGSAVLLDPLSGVRDAIPTSLLIAGHGAALWREGTQWWLGMLAP